MAKRTPGLQQRSLIHGYWGQFQYNISVPPATFAGRTGDVGSSLLPNAGTALHPAEFRKLEAGDTAATVDETVTILGSEFGLWVCIFVGTVGVGGSVWIRLDNATAAQQTIRDAHRIVVGIAGATTGTPATDILLNLSPYVAGFSADFIDTGNGTGLALAIATAAAIASPVDVRIVPGVISLESGLITTPLSIPANCRLIGAGSQLTTISGRTTADQGIFALAASSSLEGLTLSSPASVSTPGTSVGVVQATGIAAGDFSLRDVSISLVDSASKVAKTGVHAIAASSGGAKTCRLNNVSVTVSGSLSSSGISIEGYVRSTIRDCTVSDATTAVRLCSGLAPLSGNEACSISNLKGFDIRQTGILIETLTGQTPFYGISVSDSFIRFSDANATPQPQSAIHLRNEGVLDQASISNVQAHWGSSAATTVRVFGRITTTGASARAVGVSFSNCGATRTSAGAAAGLTQGLVLVATAEDSIQGSDIACDFASTGLLPADIISVTGSGVLWDHAHPRGLA